TRNASRVASPPNSLRGASIPIGAHTIRTGWFHWLEVAREFAFQCDCHIFPAYPPKTNLLIVSSYNCADSFVSYFATYCASYLEFKLFRYTNSKCKHSVLMYCKS